MKVALISDLHGQRNTLESVKAIIKQHRPGAFVVSGDITSFGNEDFLQNLFDIFAGSKIDAYVIWGNSDLESIRDRISNSPYNLNLKLRSLGTFKIYGLGDSDQPLQVDSDAVRDSIFVTHRPPPVLTLSKDIPNSPRYHISGHIHVKNSFKVYKATTLIQVPSLTLGQYAIFEPDINKIQFFGKS